ncbi:MAG TPA: ETC complex I subunit [Caulobacteraceae bacterium]|nr:ETC complex I subunit [Caulobacteraceae bacterium]
MLARIFRPARTATQSGRAKTQLWTLEFEPVSARTSDPLMGWTQTGDMNGQVRLWFETREEAIDYARRHGIPFEVIATTKSKMIIKAYADNFSYSRKQPWTH